MSNNVIPFPGETLSDIPAEQVLQAAIDAKLELAIVIGWDAKRDLYIASTTSDKAEMNWVADLFKARMLLEEFGTE